MRCCLRVRTWSIELQNTSLADAPAVLVAEAGGVIEDTSVTELEFAIPYDPEAIVDTDTYTLQARVEDANGDLLYVNDTAVMVLTDEGESTEVTFPVVAVEALPAASDAVCRGESRGLDAPASADPFLVG